MYQPSVATNIITSLRSNRYSESLSLYRLEHDENFETLEEKLTQVLGNPLLTRMKFDLAQEFICLFLANIFFSSIEIKEVFNNTLSRMEYWLEFQISEKFSLSLSFPVASNQDKFILDYGNVRLSEKKKDGVSSSYFVTACREGVDGLKKIISHYHTVCEVLELFDSSKWKMNRDCGHLQTIIKFEKLHKSGLELVKTTVTIDYHCVNEIKVCLSDQEEENKWDEIIKLERDTENPYLLGTLKNVLRLL